VRDDARGGQVVKAKCGADVVVQLFQGSDPQPLQQAGVQVKVGVRPSSPPHARVMGATCARPVAFLLWHMPAVDRSCKWGAPNDPFGVVPHSCPSLCQHNLFAKSTWGCPWCAWDMWQPWCEPSLIYTLSCCTCLPQLYVIPAPTSGEEALPPLAAPVKGLHLSDEGRPLWAVPGMEPGPDGGLDLGPAQVGAWCSC
jgi:hypothetical protein